MGQIRQLELSLQEERQKLEQSRREGEKVKAEVPALHSQQKLQSTVGEHQQMEYIRNVFKKFVETLPTGSPEHEQLIPVLTTFFEFSPDDAKAVHEKRRRAA